MSTNRKRTLRKSAASRQLALTVYQGGQAVIRETRELQLTAGKNQVQLDGLPTAFVDSSLVVLGATGPGKLNIGSSSYEPANMSGAAILAKAIGTKVTLIEQTPQGTVRNSGILKFVLGNQVVLEQDGSIAVVPLSPKYELSGIPEGLTSTPSIVFEPSVDEPGKYQVRFLYEADNINWAPRYNAFFDQKTGTLKRFECVIDITNQSGLQIEDGVFKLFTGGNYGARRSFPKGGGRVQAAAMSMSARGGGGLESAFSDDAEVEAVGEQKMYVLPEALTIGGVATKTTNLFLASDVAATTELYLPQGYYGGAVTPEDDGAKQGVNVRLRVKNTAANNLGKDMPAGEVALFVFDSSGTEQKVDSATVEARAKGEPFKLDLRKQSADVKAARRLTFVQQDKPEPEQPDNFVPEGGMEMEGAAPMTMGMRPAVAQQQPKEKVEKPLYREEEREITIFNYKDTDVEVLVHEQVPENAEFIKEPGFVNAHATGGTVKVSVEAKGKATVTYRIKYRIR